MINFLVNKMISSRALFRSRFDPGRGATSRLAEDERSNWKTQELIACLRKKKSLFIKT